MIGRQKHATNNRRSSNPGPRPAPGDESLPTAARVPAKGGTARRRQWRSRAASGLPFCSAEGPAAGGVASMSQARQGGFDADRRTQVERGQRREPARCGKGRFFGDFLVATRKSLARRGETRQSSPTEGTPRTEQQRPKPWTPACAGRRILSGQARSQQRRAAGNGETEPADLPPSAAPRRSRGRRELSRRCLSPQGEFRHPPDAGWSEGTGANRRCGRGAFW